MSYEVVHVDEKCIRGLSIRTWNADGKAVQDIGALWARFFQQAVASTIANKAGDCLYGVYTDYEGDHTMPYTYVVGCPVEKSNATHKDELVVKKILDGKYAKFYAMPEAGDMQSAVGGVWGEIWSSGLQRTYVSDFEEYCFDESGKQRIFIYIGIK